MYLFIHLVNSTFGSLESKGTDSFECFCAREPGTKLSEQHHDHHHLFNYLRYFVEGNQIEFLNNIYYEKQ